MRRGSTGPMPKPTRKSLERAARELAEILDATLFKALCDPGRQKIVSILTIEGRPKRGQTASAGQLGHLAPFCSPV